MRMNGAQAVLACLREEGVELVFGYPGGVVLTLYDALYQEGFRHILTRHEQGAVHAADGYARATGKVGVCIATSGPGATNLVTGIATAYMDSVPLVAITGQVAAALIGKDSFQEADICGITTPITKHNYLVKKAADLPRVLKEAFYIARTGRPGPVVVDVVKDAFGDEFDFVYPETVRLRGYRGSFAGRPAAVEEAAALLGRAQKPILFCGGGVHSAGVSDCLRQIVRQTGLPVISSLMGLGGVPGDWPENLGMVGMHGTYAANMATTECDVLVGIGVRFDDRVTGVVKQFAPEAKLIHFDVDAAEINKNVRVDVRVVGDLNWSLPLLAEKIALKPGVWRERLRPWQSRLDAYRAEQPMTYEKQADRLMPQEVIEELHRAAGGDAVVVTDVGQHQMWAAQFYPVAQSRAFLTSGGLGTMGYGLPAAIGAQLALPEKTVLLITGDGSIMMNCQELATAAEYGANVKIVVVNNHVLGMVNQWQRMFYDQRYAHSRPGGRTDLVKLAEAMGAAGFRAGSIGELRDALARALATAGPVLIDAQVSETADVLPMVPAGARLDQMILEAEI